MENIKIDVDKYTQKGLGDLYYGLITFISRYAGQNYDPLEVNQNGVSQYAEAVVSMKSSLKSMLDYFLTVDEVYLPSLNRNVNLNHLNIEEQLALEERCKEFIILNLTTTIKKEKQI